MPDETFTNKLIAFCQERGFIWGPSPELYGGLSGFYEYGPLGKLLKNNVENRIRKVFALHDVWEVECPTIMPASVWKASGHLGNFTDPLIKDVDGNSYRADKLIEEHYAAQGKDAAPVLATVKVPFDYLEIIKKENILLLRARNGCLRFSSIT
jgi:glycyl-tRNA synthetase (class II)